MKWTPQRKKINWENQAGNLSTAHVKLVIHHCSQCSFIASGGLSVNKHPFSVFSPGYGYGYGSGSVLPPFCILVIFLFGCLKEIVASCIYTGCSKVEVKHWSWWTVRKCIVPAWFKPTAAFLINSDLKTKNIFKLKCCNKWRKGRSGIFKSFHISCTSRQQCLPPIWLDNSVVHVWYFIFIINTITSKSKE